MQFPGMNRLLASFSGQASAQLTLGFVKSFFCIHPYAPCGVVRILDSFHQQPYFGVRYLRRLLAFLMSAAPP
jgi:hypothetical protein